MSVSSWTPAIWNTIYTTANWGWFGPSNGTFGYNGTVRSIRLDFRMKSYQGRYRNAHVDAVRVYGTVVPPTATPTSTPTSTPTPTATPIPLPTSEYPLPPCSGLSAAPNEQQESASLACQPNSGLYAEYFDDQNLQDFVLNRNDLFVNFDWGTGSPDEGIEVDTFSARWTGYTYVNSSGDYKFYVTADDGVRLWVGEHLLIDDWNTVNFPSERQSPLVSLVAGVSYEIRLEYFDSGGPASIRLESEYLSAFGSRQVISNLIAVPLGTGLTGEYFNTVNFENLPLRRFNEQIDFNWGSAAPIPSLPADEFSVRWTGEIIPLYTETYNFYTVADNSVQLWIDDQLVISAFSDPGPVETTGIIPLVAGERYRIRLDYRDFSADAFVQLQWSSASQPKEVVPRERLFGRNTAPVELYDTPSDYPTAQCLTTQRLREIAINNPQLIWGTDPVPAVDSLQWNQGVGRAFQRLVLQQLNYAENFQNLITQRRGSIPNGLPNVRPDARGDLTIGIQINGELQTQSLPASNIIEVKAKRGTITRGYSNYQMVGLIDVAITQTPFGQSEGIGFVSMFTTCDTAISIGAREEATDQQVVLLQSFVWEIPGILPYESLFWVSPGYVTNPEVLLRIFPPYQFQSALFANVPGPMSPIPPSVLGDPDPIQLQIIP